MIRVTVILVIVLLIGYYLYKYYEAITKLEYSVNLEKIDLTQFSVTDLANVGSKVKVGIGVNIKNNSKMVISFSKLNIVGTFENNLILNSSQDEPSNFNSIKILANDTTKISQVFDVYLNKELFDLIGAIRNKKSGVVEYTVSVKKLGINILTNLNYQL